MKSNIHSDYDKHAREIVFGYKKEQEKIGAHVHLLNEKEWKKSVWFME